jgi:hypothetical protein
MQSCLEKRGIEERNAEIVRSDYNITDPYSVTHKDALSDGDAQGKGTNHGGHTHSLPDCTKPNAMIDYSNFDTTNGGGAYDIDGRNDIGGRNKNVAYNLYNATRPYGANLINTELNVNQGQYQMR